MDTLIDFINSQTCRYLMYALLHTLWQGAILVGLLYLYLRTRPANRPVRRYLISLFMLFAVALGGLITWAVLEYKPQTPTLATYAPAPTIQPESSLNRTNISTPQPISGNPDRALSITPSMSNVPSPTEKRTDISWTFWGMIIWIAGVVIMLLRSTFQVWSAQRLTAQCEPVNHPEILQLIRQLCQRLRITKTIRVVCSRHVNMPAVVGIIKPAIILPIAVLTNTPATQLEAILAHELAHIRRYDYLFNCIQFAIEALLFFNPALWWISRQVRIEREACCDQQAADGLGQRVSYARALVDWAETYQMNPGLSVAPAFSENKSSGNLLDRVKRLVITNHKPALKLSWLALTVTVIGATVVLTALRYGTNAAVILAGDILMTDKERIETMEELAETYNRKTLSLSIIDKQVVSISGTVTTYDNQPLPRHTDLTINSRNRNHSGSYSMDVRKNGDFSHPDIHAGMIHIVANAKGYAPAFVGPFRAEPNEHVENINITLSAGFPSTLKVVDPQGNPIQKATVRGGYNFVPGTNYNKIKLTTNKNGIASTQHAASQSLSLTINAAGFAETSFNEVVLKPNQTTTLTVHPVEPATGIVVSQTTGQPVADADIHFIQSYHGHNHIYGKDGPILATTDRQGGFSLDSLRDDIAYSVSIKAPGYGYAYLHEIMVGQKGIKVELFPSFVLKGKIVGPLEILPRKEGKPVIYYSGGFRYEDHSHVESSQSVFVEIKGDVGAFEIKEIWGNYVNIGSKHYRTHVPLEDFHKEIVIDLTEKRTPEGKKYTKRKLVLKFDLPPDAPPPTGTMRINYLDPAWSANGYKPVTLPITGREVSLDIVAPGKFGYRMEGTVGYWFKEESEIPAEPSEEPLRVSIPVLPAGAIYGEVFDTNGQAADNVLVSVDMPEKLPEMDTPFLNVDAKDSASIGEKDNKYMAAPLPLSGTYVIVARRNKSVMLSDPVTLTREHPIRQIHLKLEEGQTIQGQIVDEKGQPVRGIPCHFNYDPPRLGSYGWGDMMTNSTGRFSLEGINFNVPGKYTLTIPSRKDYRPTCVEVTWQENPLIIPLEEGHVVEGIVLDDATGWPIPGLEVYAKAADYKQREPVNWLYPEARTDADGRFRFSNLGGIRYSLDVREARLASPDQSVIVTGGQEKKHEVLHSLCYF